MEHMQGDWDVLDYSSGNSLGVRVLLWDWTIFLYKK